MDQLVPSLDQEPEVVWDRRNDRWDTGRRSLLAFDRSATHHLVVQDDALVSRDLVAAVSRAASMAGERPLGLYIGRGRPYRGLVHQAFQGALKARSTWVEMQGPWWGVAVVVPTAHIPDLVKWADQRTDVANYDKRISRWYGHQDIRCWYTVPSLVDHRGVRENPSLVPGRTGNRSAHHFIGLANSGTDIRWQDAPFVPSRTRQIDREYRKEEERAKQRDLADRRRVTRERMRQKQAEAQERRRCRQRGEVS